MDIGLIILYLHIPAGIASAMHALLNKSDPRSAMSWIGACLFIPLAGPFLYYVFGINRVHRRARKLSLKKRARTSSGKTGGKQELSALDFSVVDGPNVEGVNNYRNLEEPSQRFTRVSEIVCRHPIYFGNHVKVLFNGKETYPAMLEAINNAQERIYLMSYIFKVDAIGEQFINALGKAKSRGVEVKVILDGIIDWVSSPRASHLLKAEGIEVENFLTISWFPPSIGVNLRNHKKLLVVDDDYAFTGGMNINYVNCAGKGAEPVESQDIHFQLQGPILEQCYALFSEVWCFITGKQLSYKLKVQLKNGSSACRAIVDGPDEELDRIELILMAAIASATKSIYLMTPYFLPSPEIVSALYTAALRGIDVQVVLPAKSDTPITDYAARNFLCVLLQRGVKIYYQPEPFAHTKLFIVDTDYVLVGSANIDTRSLRLNYELVLEIFDKTVTTTLIEHFTNSVSASQQVSLSRLENRDILTRLRDSVCWLFTPYL